MTNNTDNTDITARARTAAETALLVLSDRFFDRCNLYADLINADWGIELFAPMSARSIALELAATSHWTDDTERGAAENAATSVYLHDLGILLIDAMAFMGPRFLSPRDEAAGVLLAAGCSVVADITEAYN